MVLTASGSLGVGTMAPMEKLEVAGNVAVGKITPGWATTQSSGSRLIFAGAPTNSDLMMMYRHSRSKDASDLRVVLGDNPALNDPGADRFQIGVANNGAQ